MALKEKDFVEIEFTGRLKENKEIFDSNIKKDIEKAGLKTKPKPFIFSLGQGMFLKGVDEFLIGKKLGEEYKISLTPEKAFGKRDPKKIKLFPISTFKQHEVQPFPGAVFNFDGKMAKVLSVSGGRVRVDFNNPLAGKDVEYTIQVKRKLDDLEEKIKAFSTFLFKKKLLFDIKDKELIMKVEKPMVKFVEMFKDKFKELFDLKLKVKEIQKKSKEVEKDKDDKKENDKDQTSDDKSKESEDKKDEKSEKKEDSKKDEENSAKGNKE